MTTDDRQDRPARVRRTRSTATSIAKTPGRAEGKSPVTSAARTTKSNAGTPLTWAELVAERVALTCHRLTADAAPRGVLGWEPTDVLTAAAATIRDTGLPGHPGRHASARQQVACFTAAYARWYAPETGTETGTHAGTDLGADPGRDGGGWLLRGVHRDWLVWQHTTGANLVDVLVCGGRDDALLTAAMSARLAEAGIVGHGAGVRLLALSGPGRSQSWDGRLRQLRPLADLSAPTDPASTGVGSGSLLLDRAAS